MACIFTGSGAAARKFRNEADAGNIASISRSRPNGPSSPLGLERELLWRDARPERHAVESFYSDQGGCRALAKGVVA